MAAVGLHVLKKKKVPCNDLKLDCLGTRWFSRWIAHIFTLLFLCSQLYGRTVVWCVNVLIKTAGREGRKTVTRWEGQAEEFGFLQDSSYHDTLFFVLFILNRQRAKHFGLPGVAVNISEGEVVGRCEL